VTNYSNHKKLHWICTLTPLDVSMYTCTLATKLIHRRIVLHFTRTV